MIASRRTPLVIRTLVLLVALIGVPVVHAGVPGNNVLVDHHGQPIPSEKLQGHYLLVYFGYTACPDFCPTALTTMSQVLGLLEPDLHDLLPLFVTVDPERDTVTVMRSYVAHFNPRLVGLTGSEEAVRSAQAAFGVAAERRVPDANGWYAVDHSPFLYFAGPDGKVLKTFHANQSAAGIASDIRALVGADAPGKKVSS